MSVDRNNAIQNGDEQQSSVKGYLARLAASVGSNRDSNGLGNMTLGRFIVGSVDSINGDDGQEIADYVPTVHELKQLALYWAEERIEHDFDWFMYQATGSSEWRWSMYIGRRLNRLSEILGAQAMEEVWKESIATFRRSCPKITDEDWRIFTNGTEEEQEKWRNGILDEFK
jgi:hypothetical protein